jgi:phage tail sheath protein FI
MGTQSPEATTAGTAGWDTDATPNAAVASNGGAYGLYVFASGSATTASAEDCIDLTDFDSSLGDTSITINIPTAAGGESSTACTILFDTDQTTNPAEDANQIGIGCSGVSPPSVAESVIDAINGVVEANVDPASSGEGASGILGVTAKEGSTTSKITLMMGIYGTPGNLTNVIADVSGQDFVKVTDFTGGTNNDGTLAAIWYLNEGAMVLSGNLASQLETPPTTGAAAAVIKATNGEFKAQIYNASSAQVENVTFNLTEGSRNFVRNVFNTNPQNVNTTVASTNSLKTYWLGETFEGQVERLNLAGQDCYGTILAVASGTAGEAGPHEQRIPYRDAHSGWFFAQNLSADTSSYTHEGMQKLFKFVGINGHGGWLQDNVKISISNIKASNNENVEHGSFDVLVRKASDSDHKPVILERFSACSLNPNSTNYISRLIGDMVVEWDATENRYRENGNYPNRSDYIRVVVNETVDNNDLPSAKVLPFGVFGPPKYPSWNYASASHGTPAYGGQASATSFALGYTSIPLSHGQSTNQGVQALAGAITTGKFGGAAIAYPSCLTRLSCSNGGDGAGPTSTAYFGLQTTKTRTSTVFDPGYGDYLRPLGADLYSDAGWGDTFGEAGYPDSLVPQWRFTLDEICVTSGSTYSSTTPTANITDAAYISGSYANGTSFNATQPALGNVNYENVLNARINRFTSPLFGGFDGVNIKERNPFGNHLMTSSPTETTNYVFYTLRRAIRTVADPEVISMNLASLPGITNEEITKYLIDTCEQRADALAVIDLKGGFTPRQESNSTVSSRKGVLGTVLNNVKARNLNSSYGCAYYPWVRVRDDQTGTSVYMPPSVVALGVLANTERAADVWFAPAGFQRGGLSQGAGGLTVTGVEQKLTSANRDDLYEVNINPIASFPAEGIVVFGQKTLQATQSALDRINVRRLMIYVKRGISRIASQTIFQPNVQVTWDNFKARADNFLGDVRIRFGIDDFRVILDETTTTADLIDRNIMYAKIFIKPTRAIEFIAIDFIITRSGASFED